VRFFNKIFLPIAAAFFINCLITMKTARITPVSENSHTVAAELISEHYTPGEDLAPNIKYSFRRGLTDKFELGFNAEAVNPSLSIGMKYGFTHQLAIDVNTGFAVGIFGNVFPTGDIALIFGEKELYGGLKYELMANSGYNASGEIHPFLGYEIDMNHRYKLIPEIGIGLIDVPYDKEYWKRHGVFPGNNFAYFIGIGFSK
jgi:hypothetical protein